MFCNNCGNHGHLFKNCNLPVTSYGCILFHNDSILMINRKDSICYIEIMRGKYSFNNIHNLRLLLSRITKDEYNKLRHWDFDRLWSVLWNKPVASKQFRCKTYYKSKELLYELREKNMIDVDPETLYDETEWEFPKGRRNKKESDFDCANRELKEETNIRDEDYYIVNESDIIIEDIFGENNIPYRSIFYIGKCQNKNNIKIDSTNKEQISEIGDIQWFTKDVALSKLRDYQNTKKKIINQLF